MNKYIIIRTDYYNNSDKIPKVHKAAHLTFDTLIEAKEYAWGMLNAETIVYGSGKSVYTKEYLTNGILLKSNNPAVANILLTFVDIMP